MNEEEFAKLKARMEMHEFLMREMYTATVPLDAFRTFIANWLLKLQAPVPQETEQARAERERVTSYLHAFGLNVEAEILSRTSQAQKMIQPAGPIQ